MILLLTTALHAFFSLALMTTSTPLAADYFGALQRPYLTDLLADQHLGGGLRGASARHPGAGARGGAGALGARRRPRGAPERPSGGPGGGDR